MIDHVTAVTRRECGISGGTYVAPLEVEYSNELIFYGGFIHLADGLVKADGNCQWQTTGDTSGQVGKRSSAVATYIFSYNYSTTLATAAKCR